MIKYPYKQSEIGEENEKNIEYGNRGMDFENAVNISNGFYRDQDLAIIYKRPTPIHIVKVDYDHVRIKEAYFEKQSTTDYNGVYRGKYIDFECKETKVKSSLTLYNISSHQIKHLEAVKRHGGIAFFLVYFISLNEIYLIDAKYIIDIYYKKEKKSISLKEIKEYGVLVEQGYLPRIKYLDAIDKAYFNNSDNK